MVASGYLLQVVTSPMARRWMALLHLATGLIFATLFAGHLVSARRRRGARAVTTRGARTPSHPVAR